MKKIRFTTDEKQQENLFDLCVGFFVFVVVILSFAFNKPAPQQAGNQPASLNTDQK